MLKKVINIIQLCVMLVVGLVMTLGMMAVPLGLLYMLIAPFFGPNRQLRMMKRQPTRPRVRHSP